MPGFSNPYVTQAPSRAAPPLHFPWNRPFLSHPHGHCPRARHTFLQPRPDVLASPLQASPTSPWQPHATDGPVRLDLCSSAVSWEVTAGREEAPGGCRLTATSADSPSPLQVPEHLEICSRRSEGRRRGKPKCHCTEVP